MAGRDLLYEAFVVGAEPVINVAVSHSIPSLVQKYGQLEAETESVKKKLTDMDGFGAEQHLKAIEKKEASMIRNLENLRSKEGKLRHRVERQEKKPTFFGMGGGLVLANKDKTDRLKGELDGLSKQIAELNASLDTISETRKKETIRAKEAKELLHRKKKLANEMGSIIDQVVELTPENARMKQLKADSLELESLRSTMSSIYLCCETALKDYQRSLQLTHRARNSNMFSAVNQRNERLWQLRRDRLMTQSVAPAEKASATLVETFKTVPQRLRERYPSLMQGVGSVPLAKLSVGNFGRAVVAGAVFGNVGDAVNKVNAMRKLRQNEQQIRVCMEVVNQQMKLMRRVEERLSLDCSELVNSISTLRMQVFRREKGDGSSIVFANGVTTAHTSTASSSIIAPVELADARDITLGKEVPIQIPTVQADSLLSPTQTDSSVKLVLTMDHHVDELSPVMLQHNIVSLSIGDQVTLVGGNLESGLGGMYADYIEVKDQYGRVGKISRKVVRKLGP
mmetsp:Transcript_14673/g.19248  ORF Transcript_14673/g.19248 Transcript_14673/m.19248 type:complete len:510 (+) Transcript_14673:113-1642(+)|eukprot:CAMPEP_0184011114 /NCGR_PEP_ID=MMETSP0954-20121128/3634_1 /TAXON_ID=627963 /ORGANISM="Aplanochytrium sp, Strain PBS07" /LENGTH=509 /DNA_ID=CAMNT_0026290869 /DNA_START=60 /DNA_END=1589 /DNA_ORIENTATION=-